MTENAPDSPSLPWVGAYTAQVETGQKGGPPRPPHPRSAHPPLRLGRGPTVSDTPFGLKPHTRGSRDPLPHRGP